MTTSRTDVQEAQYAAFLRQKAKSKYLYDICQVREKSGTPQEETGEEHLFCQSKIIIDQGTQAYQKHHPETKNTKQNKTKTKNPTV